MRHAPVIIFQPACNGEQVYITTSQFNDQLRITEMRLHLNSQGRTILKLRNLIGLNKCIGTELRGLLEVCDKSWELLQMGTKDDD